MLSPVPALSETLSIESPRLNPRRVGLVSRLIGASSILLFAVLIVQAFLRDGIAGWAVGIAYILYDTFLLGFTAWQIRTLMPAPRAPSADAVRPTMGVIIAAYNEAGALGITIDTLAAQEEPPELILLADDGSTDASAATLARLYGLEMPAIGEISAPSPRLPSLRWMRLPHAGKAQTLNAAIPAIDSDLLLTVDADTLLGPGALKAMRDAFTAEPELVAATGVLQPICGRHIAGRLFQWFQRYEYVRNFLSRYAWEQLNGLLLISGAYAAFRREALVAVGGFDPISMVEDYELIHRLHRHAHVHGHDWRVRVIGGAMASTDAPAAPLAFLRQRRRWFGGFLQTQHWNRDMVGNARFGKLGTAMLPVKALDRLQPVYGLTAFALLAWFIATGRFHIALPILAIMLTKVVIDLTFHLWSLGVYRRWTGKHEGLTTGPAILAAFAEPFTFQLLRHAGALWGWLAFLRGRETWVRQRRTALEGR